MQDSGPADALVAQGIQFTVLAHAFPVLRHDAIKPISNAKLAAAMMQKAALESGAGSEGRIPCLLTDIDFMLDEGVDTVSLLAEWLADAGRRVRLDDLVHTCTKLVFAELLFSGKKVSIAGSTHNAEISLYSGRYVVLAWLLHIVQRMPDGSELAIDCEDGRRVSGHVYPGKGIMPLHPSDPNTPQAISWTSVQDLALFHGWSAQCGDSYWTLDLPSESGR